MPAGRPSEYKPEYCQQLIDHMAEGLSFESFAGLIGASKQTIYNWTEQFPEFLDAKKQGFEVSRLFWERVGNNIATGRITGNATAFIFNMKNRFRDDWKDKHEVEQSGGLSINWSEEKTYETKR